MKVTYVNWGVNDYMAVIIAVIDATFEPYICLKFFQASFLQVQKLRCITVIYFHTKISRKQT